MSIHTQNVDLNENDNEIEGVSKIMHKYKPKSTIIPEKEENENEIEEESPIVRQFINY